MRFTASTSTREPITHRASRDAREDAWGGEQKKPPIERVRFTASTSALQEAIKKVLPAVARGKAAHPALRGILFAVSEPDESSTAWLRLAATDLGLHISTSIKVTQAEPGAVVLDANTIKSIVAAATSHEIVFDPNPSAQKGEHYTIRCGRAKFSITAHAGVDEFPSFGTTETPSSFAVFLPASVLATMIEHTAYAAAKRDSRQYLTGVHISCNTDGDLLRLTATNAYRLATVALKSDIGATDGEPLIEVTGVGSQIVPAAAMEVLGRALKGLDSSDELVRLSFSPRFATLVSGADMYRARLIDGKYPDWRRVMPTTFEATVTAETADCVNATKQAGIMAECSEDTGTRLHITLAPDTGKITFRGTTQGVGAAECEVLATVEGKQLEVLCRAEYFSDILKHIPSDMDEITICFAGQAKPIATEYEIAAHGAEMGVKTLIMPFNVAR